MRGMGLGFTTGLAAVGTIQVLASGDPAQVTALLGNLTAGAIGNALSAWYAADKRPDIAEALNHPALATLRARCDAGG